MISALGRVSKSSSFKLNVGSKAVEVTKADPKKVEQDLWRARYSVPKNSNQLGADELNGLYVP